LQGEDAEDEVESDGLGEAAEEVAPCGGSGRWRIVNFQFAFFNFQFAICSLQLRLFARDEVIEKCKLKIENWKLTGGGVRSFPGSAWERTGIRGSASRLRVMQLASDP
jgi:hypothetical protein